jgi:predicted Zn-dependent protease with MMP-like domain
MRPAESPDGAVSVRRVLLSAAGALVVGLAVVSLAEGFSDSFTVRVIQAIAVFAAGAVVVGGVIGFVLVRLGGWRDPEDEDEFEALVQRAEQLAAEGRWGAADGDLPGFDDDEDAYVLDGDEDFAALVRLALDDLPLEFHRVLEHVAIVVSDDGSEHRAYGLYQGDTVARDYFTDRILIFRDTLTRDFGHDPELLRSQVTRTVRHELAHHLGWGEKGVRGLGL